MIVIFKVKEKLQANNGDRVLEDFNYLSKKETKCVL